MNPVNITPYKIPSDAVWLTRDPSSLSYLPDRDPNVIKLALDVTSVSSIDSALTAAVKHFGKDFYLDVVVNNAGYSLSGDTEAATEDQTHQEIETLFFGTARITTRAISIMRQDEGHRGGLIFNISSLAGLCGFPGHAYYHAGKFAVEGFSESVAREMHPDWNIQVHFCIIEPGGVKTSFEGHSKTMIKPHPAYAAEDMPSRKLERYVAMGTKLGMGMLEPPAVAETIFNVASRGERVPLRLPLGPTAWKLARSKFARTFGRTDCGQGVECHGPGVMKTIESRFANLRCNPYISRNLGPCST